MKKLSVLLVFVMLFSVICAAGAQEKSYLERAYDGEFAGTVVTFDGPFVDNDERYFNESIAEFEEKTGIDIQYNGSKDFEATIQMRVEGGQAPDIADFPQPSILGNLAKKGFVIDARDAISEDWLNENYSEDWLKMAMMEGPDGEPMMAGIWARANGKSQVFYRPDVWAEAGYEVPTTWDEMIELSKKMVEDGETPWCIGIESGAASGWPATDWIEDIMLRTVSPEQYDAWVAGELKFDSPEVRRAIDIMSEIWFTDGFVLGGRDAINSRPFGESALPLFADVDGCMMHRQGNFITAYFDSSKVPGVDYDVFYLPPIDEEYGRPFLGGGDIYGLFSDKPEAKAAFEFFSHGESLKVWLGYGGAISPHKDTQPEWFGNPVEMKISDYIANADTFRFDGSDAMNSTLQTNFLKGMVNLVKGDDVDSVIASIDGN